MPVEGTGLPSTYTPHWDQQAPAPQVRKTSRTVASTNTFPFERRLSLTDLITVVGFGAGLRSAARTPPSTGSAPRLNTLAVSEWCFTFAAVTAPGRSSPAPTLFLGTDSA